MASLMDVLGVPPPPTGLSGVASSSPSSPGKAVGGDGGGGAQGGLNQINQGSQTVASAIGSAEQALGGAGGNETGPNERQFYKKGGGVKKDMPVKKNYTTGGRLNLGSGGVSTASRNSKNSCW